MEKLHSWKRIVDISEPILAEDSTFTSLALSLNAILEQLSGKATHHDYLVALLLVLLAESGFCVSEEDHPICANTHVKKFCLKSLESKSVSISSELSLNSNIFECNRNTRLVHIPANWKSAEIGIYEIYLKLHKLSNIKSKFIAKPLGDKLILNMYQCTQKTHVYNMIVKSLKYVNPYTNNLYRRYMNLREISHKFKDSLATPSRIAILTELGLKSPSLWGLPMELQNIIASVSADIKESETTELSLPSNDFLLS